MTPVNVLVQIAYSFVIGFLLGAIYIRTEDFASVVLIHFLIDFSNQIFANSPAVSPVYMIPVFLAILAIETWWAWNFFRKAEATLNRFTRTTAGPLFVIRNCRLPVYFVSFRISVQFGM